MPSEALAEDLARNRNLTIEAFADTIVPGEKRWPGDLAVAGAARGPGAVAAGALELLEWSAAGVSDGLDDLARMLNEHAAAFAEWAGLDPQPGIPPFVALPFGERTALVENLVSPGHPEKDAWVALALFSNMAFDTGAHLHTLDAIAAGHPGIEAMGLARPDADGLWRFPQYGYGRRLADLHPHTTSSGSPA